MESAEGNVFDRGADQFGEAFFHLPGGFVGEGDRQDAARVDADHLDKVGDAVGNDAGLAAARPGEYQYRAVNSLDGLSLGGVKFSEDIHVSL